MKLHRVWAVAALAVVAIVSAGLIAAEAGKEKKTGEGPPPLKVDKEAPLLLDDPPAKTQPGKPAKGPVADNGACFVCHTNYQEESMAVSHARANVGCVKCHGDSFAHRNDEDNITPPDTMFPTAKIDASCKKCHEGHDVAATKVVARWQERCAAKSSPKDIVCTDCHGEHRLKLRTVRWDKETRKLLSRTGKPESKQ